MKKILHIIQNDPKFINTIVKLFKNNKEVENTFIIESNTKIENTNFIKDIIFLTSKNLVSQTFIKSISDYDIIIVHFLSKGCAKLILKTSNPNIIWSAWGADFYQANPILERNLYGNKTKILKKKLSTFRNVYLKPIAQYLIPNRYTYYWQKKAIKKISHIAPVIYEDYELIKESYNAPHLKFLNFSYGNLEEDFLDGLVESCKIGNNILLGNSSSFTNNHVEIIDLLASVKIKSKEIITPLSYGDITLKNYLLKYGKSKLGDNFYPLTSFMNKQKYHKLLTSCGYVIMNHRRQQALGNIITMLFIGAKVFFNKQNPTFTHFKKLGAYVYSIEDLMRDKELALFPLTEEQILKNREILMQTRGKEVVEKFIYLIGKI